MEGKGVRKKRETGRERENERKTIDRKWNKLSKRKRGKEGNK